MTTTKEDKTKAAPSTVNGAARPLAKKLAYVMGQMSRIPKRGYNEFHKYEFATESDVSDALRGLLAEQNIAFFPSMVSYTCDAVETARSTAYHVITQMEMTFIDGDTGDTHTSSWIGEALDSSDKAVNKTATAATKYFLLKTFLLSSGEDPDAGGTEVGAHTAPAQRKMVTGQAPGNIDKLKQVAADKGIEWSKIEGFIASRGKDPNDLTDEQVDEWTAWLVSYTPKDNS